MMRLPQWLHPPKGIHWTPRLTASLALIVIAGVIAFSGVMSLLSTLLTFGGDVDPASALQNSLKKHEELAKLDRERFDGRSAFFMPSAPVRNIPKPPPPKIEKPPEPPPPPAIPAEYTGKKPIAVLGPIVYFDNFQIKVGEESNGIKVIATNNAPWSVKLGHEGGEYDVAIWPQKKEDFFNGKWSTIRTPGIESTSAPAVDKEKTLPGNAAGRGRNSGRRSADGANRTGPNGSAAPAPVLTPGATPGPAQNPPPGAPPPGDPAAGSGGSPAAAPPENAPAQNDPHEPPKPVQPPVPAQPTPGH